MGYNQVRINIPFTNLYWITFYLFRRSLIHIEEVWLGFMQTIYYVLQTKGEFFLVSTINNKNTKGHAKHRTYNLLGVWIPISQVGHKISIWGGGGGP